VGFKGGPAGREGPGGCRHPGTCPCPPSSSLPLVLSRRRPAGYPRRSPATGAVELHYPALRRAGRVAASAAATAVLLATGAALLACLLSLQVRARSGEERPAAVPPCMLPLGCEQLIPSPHAHRSLPGPGRRRGAPRLAARPPPRRAERARRRPLCGGPPAAAAAGADGGARARDLGVHLARVWAGGLAADGFRKLARRGAATVVAPDQALRSAGAWGRAGWWAGPLRRSTARRRPNLALTSCAQALPPPPLPPPPLPPLPPPHPPPVSRTPPPNRPPP
jgi:hypothetical protein